MSVCIKMAYSVLGANIASHDTTCVSAAYQFLQSFSSISNSSKFQQRQILLSFSSTSNSSSKFQQHQILRRRDEMTKEKDSHMIRRWRRWKTGVSHRPTWQKCEVWTGTPSPGVYMYYGTHSISNLVNSRKLRMIALSTWKHATIFGWKRSVSSVKAGSLEWCFSRDLPASVISIR